MIRQAISCDICGSEKKQTNHWFVATEHGGELRVSGWASRNRWRAETKHLCGQTCLHKLMDEFVARTIDGRSAVGAVAAANEAGLDKTDTRLDKTDTRLDMTDTSLTARSPALRRDVERVREVERAPVRVESALPVAMAATVEAARPVVASPLTLVSIPVRAGDAQSQAIYTPRHSRAEAWERERERTQVRSDLGRPHKRF